MRSLLCVLSIAMMVLFGAGCSSDSGDSGDDGGNEGEYEDGGGGGGLDWFTSDCSAMGGEVTPTGACYIPCTESSECPSGTLCGGSDEDRSPLHMYCRVERYTCEVDTDCGPDGWSCDFACLLPCTSGTGEAEQSSECATGMACTESYGAKTDYACAQFDEPSTSCGSCPSGCCSPSGLSCCQPPFCSGDCVGSPCCG